MTVRISLENHKKKVPYEGPTRRSDRAAVKTRTALPEMPRARPCSTGKKKEKD